MTRYTEPDQFRGAQFIGVNMSGTLFREVDLSGVRMYGVLLIDADIDGAVNGLRVNGVEVLPLVEAELDRRYPERTKLRPTTADGMREAWAVVESFWDETMRRARLLTDADLRRSVNGEWSFAETLRHLVFVTDAWFGRAVRGDPHPFHPLGLPASFSTDTAALGIDPDISPEFQDVLAARAGRVAQVRAFLHTLSQQDLDRVREPIEGPGWPPPAPRTAASCLLVLLNEEWAHHRFAVRDLSIIEAERQGQ